MLAPEKVGKKVAKSIFPESPDAQLGRNSSTPVRVGQHFSTVLWSSVRHVEFLLPVRSYSIPNGSVDSIFENLSNDVSRGILIDVEGKRRKRGGNHSK